MYEHSPCSEVQRQDEWQVLPDFKTLLADITTGSDTYFWSSLLDTATERDLDVGSGGTGGLDFLSDNGSLYDGDLDVAPSVKQSVDLEKCLERDILEDLELDSSELIKSRIQQTCVQLSIPNGES